MLSVDNEMAAARKIEGEMNGFRNHHPLKKTATEHSIKEPIITAYSQRLK